jgi:hypothetical protein
MCIYIYIYITRADLYRSTIHPICLSIQQNLLILQRTFGIYYISPYYHHARALSHDGNSVSDSLIPCAVMRFPCRTPQWVSVHGTRFTERRTSTYASCKFRSLKARIVWLTRNWTFWIDPEDGGTIIFWSRDSSPNYTAYHSRRCESSASHVWVPQIWHIIHEFFETLVRIFHAALTLCLFIMNT